MRKNVKMLSKTLILSLVIVLFFSATTGFAATYRIGKIGSYTTEASLAPLNPLLSNPYATALTRTSAPLYSLQARVSVINPDGTTSSKSKTQTNTRQVVTDRITSNSYWSKDVSFTGYHYVYDANIGSWNASTNYTFK